MPPQNTHEIFRKELELFEKLHTDTDCSQRDKCKSFLLASLRRASLARMQEERQFILNILDGVDIADKEMGNTGGGTRAIRHALQSRIIDDTTLATARTIVEGTIDQQQYQEDVAAGVDMTGKDKK